MSAVQPTLFETKESRIQREFEEFHRANPHVYELLCKYARQVKDAGRSRYSMDAIFHRIRWHVRIELRKADPFKLNDHYTSRYARLVMEREPDLKDFFETRELKERGQ